MGVEPVAEAAATEQWTIDAVARTAGLPVRTIREYQTLGLLHRPRRAGRVGLYDVSHLRRLQLIARLQARGYSLAGIGDLLSAWRDGAALADVLRLEPDQLVHIDEPGAVVTLTELTELLPALVPDRLDDLVATGVVEASGPARYCVPSPSLLQLTIDTLAVGVDPDAVLELLTAIRTAADTVTDAVVDAVTRIPATAADDAVEAAVGRARGLLAHGVGRLTMHRLGRRLGVTDDSDIARRLGELRRHGTKARPGGRRRRAPGTVA